MKKQREKRVVILDHLASEGIEQAIFILKESAPLEEVGIVSEANRIVRQYVKQVQAGQYRPPQKKKKWFFQK